MSPFPVVQKHKSCRENTEPMAIFGIREKHTPMKARNVLGIHQTTESNLHQKCRGDEAKDLEFSIVFKQIKENADDDVWQTSISKPAEIREECVIKKRYCVREGWNSMELFCNCHVVKWQKDKDGSFYGLFLLHTIDAFPDDA